MKPALRNVLWVLSGLGVLWTVSALVMWGSMARTMNGNMTHSAGNPMRDGAMMGGMWMMWLTWLVMLVLAALFVYLIVSALRGRGGNLTSSA